MEIKLEKITDKDHCLEQMFCTYVAEMVKFLDHNKNNKSVDAIEILNKYWQQRPVWAHFIIAENSVAGFCLLRRYPGEPLTMDIEQFYVAEKYRHQGVGSRCMAELVTRHAGNWLVRVLKTNAVACQFWVKAIETCVGDNYQIKNESDDMHFIRFHAGFR